MALKINKLINSFINLLAKYYNIYASHNNSLWQDNETSTKSQWVEMIKWEFNKNYRWVGESSVIGQWVQTIGESRVKYSRDGRLWFLFSSRSIWCLLILAFFIKWQMDPEKDRHSKNSLIGILNIWNIWCLKIVLL